MLLKSPLKFMVYEKGVNDEHRELLSVKDIEWRFILANKTLSLNIELPYVHDRTTSIGILKVDLSLEAKDGSFALISEDLLDTQLMKEKELVGLKTKRFFEFSRSWWDEYKGLNSNFENRAVKIYASDLYGALKPVCYFLGVLKCRGINTAEEAARFVSLIPFEGAKRLENDKTEW